MAIKQPPPDLSATYDHLKTIFAPIRAELQATTDNPIEHIRHTLKPSPFKQHKGKPMYFASVRRGKAYISFHLFPLYTHPKLLAAISPELKKRMQGKVCFNFKRPLDPDLYTELQNITLAAFAAYQKDGLA